MVAILGGGKSIARNREEITRYRQKRPRKSEEHGKKKTPEREKKSHRVTLNLRVKKVKNPAPKANSGIKLSTERVRNAWRGKDAPLS